MLPRSQPRTDLSPEGNLEQLLFAFTEAGRNPKVSLVVELTDLLLQAENHHIVLHLDALVQCLAQLVRDVLETPATSDAVFKALGSLIDRSELTRLASRNALEKLVLALLELSKDDRLVDSSNATTVKASLAGALTKLMDTSNAVHTLDILLAELPIAVAPQYASDHARKYANFVMKCLLHAVKRCHGRLEVRRARVLIQYSIYRIGRGPIQCIIPAACLPREVSATRLEGSCRLDTTQCGQNHPTRLG